MILWHSGTGNSRHVALELSGLLDERALRIGEADGAALRDAGDRIVWVFPVYGWGVPPVVRDFMLRRAGGLKSARHFMVVTCGDDVGLTHRQWRKLVDRTGGKAVGAWSVQMPNNYVLLPGFDVDSKGVERRKLEECGERIAAVARGIRHGARVDDVVMGSAAWVKSRVLYPLFCRFLMSPKPFRASEKCTGCGVCSKECPARNIAMEGKRPEWGRRCSMCLSCYHRCPFHAVEYGQRTLRKGQYFFKK